MKDIVISIVIAAGPKREKDLFYCLESIYKSTYKKFEVIVVDNSCSGLSLKIKNAYPLVKVITMPHNTGVLAYNIGFVNAQGKYIFTLDDDSSIKENTLENLVKTFGRKEKNVGILTLNLYNPYGKYFYYPHYIASSVVSVTQFMGGGCAFKRELLEKVGYYDKDFFFWENEEDLAIRFLNAGYSIHFEKNIIVNHHEKINSKERRNKIFYIFRNKAWINVKHFPLRLIPFLLFKDIVWFLSIAPIKKRYSLEVFSFFIVGTINGYLFCKTPLQKRKVISKSIQKKYMDSYFAVGKYVMRTCLNYFPKLLLS